MECHIEGAYNYPNIEEQYNDDEKKMAQQLRKELNTKHKDREGLEKDVYRFRNDLLKHQSSRKHLEERHRKLTLKEQEVDEEIRVLRAEIDKRKRLIEDFKGQKNNLLQKINALAPGSNPHQE